MEQFEQLLTCCVCLDRYRNPKLLPCQHSFCMEPCMDGLVDYVRRQVKCPECRAEHRIPYQGVQGFPTNVTLQRFLELHIEITGELPDPTSGQIMERCTVCSEKSYCTMCRHCEKKTCSECKSAHMDILRREIARINNQIRRGIHRLQDVLSIVEKNSVNLQSNCLSVSEEVDEIFRRLSKALKDRTDALRMDVDRYLGSEIQNLNILKENLELEIANIQSNCDLADKYITENIDWEDNELMDTKEIFLKTIEFIRNFEYETGDYARRVRFSMSMDPNQLVMHVATYGELSMSSGHVGGSVSSNSGILQLPSGPGLMRSKSDHRLASQLKQDDNRNYGRSVYDEGDPESILSGRKFGERPVPKQDVGKYHRNTEYDYDYEESHRPARSRFRSRFVKSQQDNDSDNDQGNKNVRFTESTGKERERVLDTEDVSKGPLSGIFRLTDSPRVIKRIQDSELRGKKKDKEISQPVQVQAKRQTPTRLLTVSVKQTSEDDEINKIKRQIKDSSSCTNTSDIRPTSDRVSALKRSSDEDDDSQRNPNGSSTSKISQIEAASSGEDSDESVSSPQKQQKGSAASVANKSTTPSSSSKFSEAKKLPTRSSSTESTSAESSDSSCSRNRKTGAAYTTDEVKQKIYNSNADTIDVTRSRISSPGSLSDNKGTTISPATSAFQSRFINRSTASPTIKKSNGNETEETETTSEEETEESSEEPDEKESKDIVNNIDMAQTDIGPLLARSSQAREGAKPSKCSRDDSSSSKEVQNVDKSLNRSMHTKSTLLNNDSLSKFARIRPSLTEPLSSARHVQTRPVPAGENSSSRYNPSGYTSRFLNKSKSTATLSIDDDDKSPYEDDSKYGSGRARYMALKERRNRLARSKSSHTFADDEDLDEPISPTTTSPSAYIAMRYGSSLSGGSELARSRSSHTLKSRETSPERSSGSGINDKDGAALSSWARYLKNKYGNRGTKDLKDNTAGTSTSISPSSSNSAARRLSLGLPLRSANEQGSSDDDSKNVRGSPISPMATTAAAGIAVVGSSLKDQYLQKRRQLFQIGSRGSEPGYFTWPRGIAVGPDNTIVVADSSNHRVQVFEHNGQFIKEFGAYGSGEGEFDCLAGVAVNRIGQYIIADRYNHRIQVLDPSGRFLRSFGSQGASDGKFNYPWGITTDALGFIYVCDKENHRVQVFQSDGTFVGKFGSCGTKPGQLEHPHYIAVSNTNRVIVSDSNNHRIQIFDVNGRVLSAFGTEGSNEGQFKFPRGVAVDDQGYIVVADSGNNRVQIFNPDGSFLRAFGCWGNSDSEFKGLEGIAVSSNGSILVCDRENHRVQVF